MRPLETLLLLACLPALFAGIFWPTFTRRHAIAFALMPAVLAGLQGFVEGPRFHLFPLYVLAGGLAIAALTSWVTDLAPPGKGLAVVSLFGLAFAAASGALAWLFPVFSLPAPPGPYPVGTTSVHLVDPVREEVRTALQADTREVPVQFWYPAWDGAWQKRAPYLPLAELVPPGLLSQLRLVRANALADAAVAPNAAGWPVLIFSHSWDGGRFENTALCEALASAGFIVAAPDHPYGARLVEFPDGRRIPNTGLPRPDFATENAAGRFLAAAHQELEVRTEDLRLVLAALFDLQSGALADRIFEDKLDLGRVGAMGVSFGAVVAVEFCRREPHTLAGAGIDATFFAAVSQGHARQPFLFVTDTSPMPSGANLHSPDAALRRRAEFVASGKRDLEHWLDTRGGLLAKVPGASPANFSDRPLYSRLRRFTGAGDGNARKILADTARIVTRFFGHALAGETAALEELAAAEKLEWFPPQ